LNVNGLNVYEYYNSNSYTSYVLDGEDISTPPELRTARFALQHPIIAYKVGQVISGKTNISTNASRFSTNNLGLVENKWYEGSQVNAFRHALWQATITKSFGANIAFEIGNAHEKNPNLVKGVNDFSNISFTTISIADEACDLLNNDIGRKIGSRVNSSSMNDIAISVINYYHDYGLWVAVENQNGYYSIKQEKLSDEQYKHAYGRLLMLDKNGYAPGQK
jgi:hypothetical protein